jgi:hypothetical protein
MSDTRALIDRLAAVAAPVRPIASPGRRTLQWALGATILVTITAASFGLRRDLGAAMSEPAQALEWIGSVLTGLCAAYAAFQVSVPGRSPSWAWLPALPAALWMSGIGWGCLADFATQGMAAFALQTHSGDCARAIVAMSLPLTVFMLLMVRHAGVVRPGATAMLAALAAAAVSAAGVSLFHSGENSLMLLLWHVGAVALLSVLSLALGRRLFGWIGYTPGPGAR